MTAVRGIDPTAPPSGAGCVECLEVAAPGPAGAVPADWVRHLHP